MFDWVSWYHAMLAGRLCILSQILAFIAIMAAPIHLVVGSPCNTTRAKCPGVWQLYVFAWLELWKSHEQLEILRLVQSIIYPHSCKYRRVVSFSHFWVLSVNCTCHYQRHVHPWKSEKKKLLSCAQCRIKVGCMQSLSHLPGWILQSHGQILKLDQGMKV